MMIISSFLLFSCSEKDEDVSNVDIAPVLISSDPFDGEDNILKGERIITLVFNQNITLSNRDNININGGTIKSADAIFKKLTIEVTLNEDTEYILQIPAKTVKGPTGVFNEEINIKFKTKAKTEVTIKKELVTTNASKEAVNVYNFLINNYGKSIISGTMANVSWNYNEAMWVYKHTGKYPAMNGYDYGHLAYSPANWIDYSDISPVKDWWDMNGLVSIGWHWNVPVSQGSEELAFYSDKTRFSIDNAVIDGTYENDIIKADLEKLSNYILLLKNEGIPVLWRPLHEAAGGWFWWGKNSESYKKLWIIMFETFQSKGLNNLIWVWTTETNDNDWYPGDNYVDIIGRDIYNLTSAKDINEQFQKITETYPDKIITLSECGSVSGLNEQINSGAMWLWAMPWYDYDVTNQISSDKFNAEEHIHANITWWKNSFSSDKVIDLSKMPNLK